MGKRCLKETNTQATIRDNIVNVCALLDDVHVSFTHTDKDKADKTFSFAFFKVMRSDGSIISDGQHRLYVYKVSMTTPMIV